MSDKGFGDHVNRNVKNSLLSSSVIGLSLEDLTHKAVLLPATPSQGQIARSDQPHGSQPRALTHAGHDKQSLPSGDAFSNISLTNTPSDTLPNKLDSSKNYKNNENIKPATITQSKASVKSDDDFDVNEYIARLQGTRYVSAPLHSHLKEEQKTNLEAEESLEEINLNESSNEPIQQSLTADIAQNFSQLPTVLPHVANAVFTSFTNMLMKSREQTPDDAKSGYQDVQFEGADAVPLMGVDEAPKDFGLPPKEPTVTGTSSYRINSKKKYAQIPGLTGSAAQNIYSPNIQLTPGSQLAPLMTPEIGLVINKETETLGSNAPFSSTETNVSKVDECAVTHVNLDTNVFNPITRETSSTIDSFSTDNRNVEVAFNIKENKDIIQFPDGNQSGNTVKEKEQNFTPIDNKDIITPRIPIIPPPPMFSNLTRSNQAVGKSVLPPSVARRISANQPLIKQPIPPPTFSENIFVPIIPESDPIQPSLPSSINPDLTVKPAVQSQFNVASVPMIPQSSSVPLFTPADIPASSVSAPFFTPSSTETIPSSTFATQTKEKSEFSTFETQKSNVDAFPAFGMSAPNVPLSTPATNPPLIPASNFGSGSLPSSLSSSASAPSSSTQPFVPMFPPTTQMVPPVFFNPSLPQQNTHPINPGVTPEPAKPLVEPPKATGNVNFRMTKKRPQYYSGPIEGVGDISNNVKPIIADVISPAVDRSVYQGSVFTPNQDTDSIEPYTPTSEIKATVMADTSRPVEPTSYASIESKSQSYIPFEVNTVQKNYTADYSTAFDLSRPTTEKFDPPKQEPKKIGIIGSLKSKLSSIGIGNKIQNTVTTFFDPAYNDAKGEPALETAPYSRHQYGQYSQRQSSFEVVVPSVEQNQYNQFGCSQGYSSYDQNQYYKAQNAYSYDQNEEQRASGYFAEPGCSTHQVEVHHPPNRNTQEYSNTSNMYTQENIPQNIENISSQNIKHEKEVNLYDSGTIQKPKIENVANYPKESTSYTPFVSPNVGSHGAIGDVAIKTSIEQEYKPLPPVKTTNFFDRLLGTDETIQTYKKTAIDTTSEVEIDFTQGKVHFSSPLPPAMSFFDNPISLPEEPKQKADNLVDEMAKLALAEEIAIANSPFQAIDLQLSANSESKVIDTSTALKAVGHSAITTIALDKNVHNYPINKEADLGIDKKGISLMESLTKDTTPVVAVSSVPLFGLSAIITDKTQETSSVEKDLQNVCLIDTAKEIKPLLEKQAFSLFENIAAENKLRAEPTKLTTGLSITDLKNVLLIEPPQKVSSSLLKDLPEAEIKNIQNLSEDRDGSWNLDANMVTSKDNVNVLFDRKASGFFDHVASLEQYVDKTCSKKTDATEHTSDFNICETCREVNTPGKETDNVTNQLIENMNSSIKLSNPVEEVLTESNPIADRAFEDMEFSEIDRITKDTIETIQGQSSNEQSDSVGASSINSYGWNTEHLAYASLAAIDQDFATNTDLSDFNFKTDDNNKTGTDPEYVFKVDPNTIGFFGDNSLFFDNVPKNASDELKAGFKTNDDVLPEQSVPSAPPAEEDSKSDETGGLDVLLIEQDAKKDFPIEEEFIIEPSKTDDDKMEFRERKRSSEDSVHDTFAGRIEKFKNKAGTDVLINDDILNQKPTEIPPKSMASYFDTGNYAAEAHYKNSLTSPTHNTVRQEQIMTKDIFNEEKLNFGEGMRRFPSDEPFRLPPGFEDEIRRQFMEQQMKASENKEVFIPETSTQTSITTTATFQVANIQHYAIAGLNADSKTVAHHGVIKDGIPTMEQFAKNIAINPTADETKHTNKDNVETPTLSKAFDSTNSIIKDHTQIFSTQIEKALEPDIKESVPLPDPINFFSANTEEAKVENTDPAESFNRLASYFSMSPAQPDHSKSFFELSESQNHYRHVNTEPKPNENLNQEQVNVETQAKIQNLMNDLTSTQNVNFKEETVRIVNYFSVEYDTVTGASKIETVNLKLDKNDVNINEENNYSTLNLGDEDDIPSTITNTNSKEDKISKNSVINTIKTCKYCCNINLLDIKNIKFKTAADSDNKKESEITMTDKAKTDNKQSVSVDFGNIETDKETQDGVTVVPESRCSLAEYSPVRHHWFYRVDVDDKSVWRGFSMTDSTALERAYLSHELTEETLIPTDGGRFDVNIIGRLRLAVYWKEKPTNVRRCSWFYKGTTDARYVPYTESVADKLEEEYRHGVTTGEWHRRLVLPNNELVVMHGPAVMVHFLHGGCSDSFSSPPFLLGKKVYRNPPKIRVARDLRSNVDHLILVVHGAGEYKKSNMPEDSTSRPRVVRRGHEESEIEDPEPSNIDHLLLLCHGVGSACDMRFRSVEEVVEDFRATSLQLLQSHYRNSFDNGIVSRVEVLPISWHAQLHVGEGGVDKRLNKVTLESIPRLRAFTNHTVLDALFYTSPVYHQTIIDTVCFELNRIYSLFKERNPNFKGGVSLGGHSLGSVILYDLLCHQTPKKPLNLESSSNKTYLPSTKQPLAKYPQLKFPPAALYALGSPIAIFECIRGVEALGIDFALPTCKNFFNIFHPYDPIAYRIEPLINPLLQDAKPFLIPHHKGRKRMHLELKDTMVRVGADLKQKLVESLRTTWNKWKSTPPPDGQLEKVVEEEMEKEQLCSDATEEQINAELTTPEMLGKLNDGRRIDYVLQEAPLEMINEYLFAMSSHVGYWESEDTMLLMLREIYSSLGVQPDCTVPQQSMTITKTKLDEATIVNEKEGPSTSRGST